MQKKLILFFIIFNGIFLYGNTQSGAIGKFQFDHIALYELRYFPDSTATTVQTSIQALLIGKDTSLFAAYGNLNYDTAYYQRGSSIGYKEVASFNIDSHNKYRIFKYNTSIETYDKMAVIGSPWIRYSENKSILNWKLLSDTSTIMGLLCQKAECDFGNRHWIAWFALSIPISDGPYKFCGLPGLIVKVSDVQQYWSFEITSFQPSIYPYPKGAIFHRNEKQTLLQANKSSYMDLLKNSYDNGFELEAQYGIKILNHIEDAKKRYAERAKKENNWIELYKPTK